MPSRAEVRGGIETGLRVLSIVLLVVLLWRSLDRSSARWVVSSRSANLESAVKDWSVAGKPPDSIVVHLDSTPSPLVGAWLAALRGAGSGLTWSGDLPAVGVAVNRVAAPRGGLSVLVAAPLEERIRIGDDVGVIDTAQAGQGGARFTVPSANGTLVASVNGSSARAFLADSVVLRRVLVLGTAGWEAKFVTAALEEDGWKVDAQMRVAPGVTVAQGAIGPIDTARYSAVIALDAAAASESGAIARYAASGGGVIIAGTAASIGAFAPLRAASPGRLDASPTLASEPGSVSLRSLSLVSLASLRRDAIILERRSNVVSAAARRHVAGRVLQHCYTDTWLWRMRVGDRSVADHRDWWTRAVASVAYAPRIQRSSIAEGDEAPYARLVESLGPPSNESGTRGVVLAGAIPLWWLFALLLVSLLAEWASRRLRGAR